jgi:LuxR family maltose regulon positive regulatory protein
MIQYSLVQSFLGNHLVHIGQQQVLPRMRLVELIGSPPACPITLVTAPAGFGKTTLAMQWAKTSAHTAVWMSLHSESNTPGRFLADLEHALRDEKRVGDTEKREPSLETARLRIRALAARGPITLVIDDFHEIENRDVHRIMNALIDGLPDAASLVILSRVMPPLALGRLRVEGKVREITEVDLRFEHDEVMALVRSETRDRLDPQQIALLAERTEGWIAGIRLALLAIRQVQEDQIDATISGLVGNRWLDSYIVEEVLESLPADLRTFVLRTASLGFLDPNFCDAVLGLETSAAMIDELVRRLVFVRRDARAGRSFTYHSLFAECVERIARRSFSASELSADHARAAEWLVRHAEPETALAHVLRAADWPVARQILRTICTPLWERDLHHSLLHWMEKLPIEQIRPDRELLYWYIHKLFSVGRVREAMLQFEVAEPLWRESGDPSEMSYVFGCRSFKAAYEGSADLGLQYSYQALGYLSPHASWVTRMRLWGSVCEREFWRGNDDVATKAYQLAQHCRRFLPMEQRWWTLNVETGRINQYALRGNLTTAERLYRAALERFSPEFRDADGRTRFRMAAIYLEWNDLDRAQAEIDRITRDLEHFPWQFWYPEAWLIAARIAMARGDHKRTEATLNRLFAAAGDLGESHTTDRARALRAQLWLEQGELLLAGAWGDSIQLNECKWTQTFGEIDPYLVMIQLRIAQEQFDLALSLATTRIAEGLVLKRHGELVELYVLQTIALQALGETERSIAALRAALQLAIPGRFARALLPLKARLQPFLALAMLYLTAEEADYIQFLISPAPGEDAPSPVQASVATPALREALSARELEVLALLGTGLINREIAERLFIAERTVKKHLANTFAKLGVDNRVSAVVRARELGLLA